MTLNRTHSVYLAGPITGLSYDGAQDWRTYAYDELAKFGIKGLSPMRAKEFLRAQNAPLSGTCVEYGHINVLASPRGIMTRDRYDATNCNILLVNFLGAKKVSVGTVMEIAWADLCRTPIVIAMEAEGNPHEHAMLAEATGYRVPTLDEALHIVKSIVANEAVNHG